MELSNYKHKMTAYDPKRTFSNFMKIALLIFLFCISGATQSGEDLWKPDPKFQLEDADYLQTLSWVSGVSYTLSKIQAEKMFLCGGPESVGSKEIIGYLNNEHSGEKITSEQAIATIFKELKLLYPCNEK